MDETSLTDFVGDGTDPGGGDPEPDTSDGTDPGDDDPVEPAVTTYQWDPDGLDCAACGATVERRWRGEAGPVCADCKEW